MKKNIFLLLFPLLCQGQEVKRTYYNSGAILSEANYKNGKMEGKFTSYTKYGRIKEEGFYKYTEAGVYSERTGIWKRYYDSGELNTEITYDENGRSVKYISYEKDGTIMPISEGGC